MLKSGPSDKRLCKTSAGCHVRGASFVWPKDTDILSLKVLAHSGVYSWPHRFTEGQARSNRTKQLKRQQKAKPLWFIYIPAPKKPHQEKKTSHFAGVALWSWHTDPHRNLFPAAGFRVIREGIISQGGPASVPFIIQKSARVGARTLVRVSTCQRENGCFCFGFPGALSRVQNESTLGACHQYCCEEP